MNLLLLLFFYIKFNVDGSLSIKKHQGRSHKYFAKLNKFPVNEKSSHQDDFSNYCYLFFISRSNLIFQKGLFVRRTDMFFSRRSIDMVFEQTHIFQEGLSNRPYYLIQQILIFPETIFLVLEFFRSLYFFIEHNYINFPGTSFSSSNRYSFSRKPYVVLERKGKEVVLHFFK